jgi:hypothetical protein
VQSAQEKLPKKQGPLEPSPLRHLRSANTVARTLARIQGTRPFFPGCPIFRVQRPRDPATTSHCRR